MWIYKYVNPSKFETCLSVFLIWKMVLICTYLLGVFARIVETNADK